MFGGFFVSAPQSAPESLGHVLAVTTAPPLAEQMAATRLRALTQPNIGGLANAEDSLAAAGGSPAHTRKSMKYEVRWSNGFWKTFDLMRYQSVAIHHTEAEAIIAVAKANG